MTRANQIQLGANLQPQQHNQEECAKQYATFVALLKTLTGLGTQTQMVQLPTCAQHSQDDIAGRRSKSLAFKTFKIRTAHRY